MLKKVLVHYMICIVLLLGYGISFSQKSFAVTITDMIKVLDLEVAKFLDNESLSSWAQSKKKFQQETAQLLVLRKKEYIARIYELIGPRFDLSNTRSIQMSHVQVELWKWVMGSIPERCGNSAQIEMKSSIKCVTLDEIVEFIARLNRKTNRFGFHFELPMIEDFEIYTQLADIYLSVGDGLEWTGVEKEFGPPMWKKKHSRLLVVSAPGGVFDPPEARFSSAWMWPKDTVFNKFRLVMTNLQEVEEKGSK